MTPNDDDIFERALRADLPSADQQERSRKRLLAMGLSAGSGLAASSAASAAQASWGATLVAKVAALSWPATLGLAAAVATPVVALPLWLAPAHPSMRAAVSAPASRPANESMPRSEVTEPTRTEPVGTSVTPDIAAPVAQRAPFASAATPARAAGASAATQPAVAAFAAVNSGQAARAPVASTLAAETQLLDRAFVELDAGRYTAAAALIAEHARRYPNGLLRQERERAQARLARDSKEN
jgi:hypothetical protein